MSDLLRTISPIDGQVCVERPWASESEIERALASARRAQASWRRVSLGRRAELCLRFVEIFESRRAEIAREITLQMGRPIAHSPGEISGLAERARAMIELAPDALAPLVPSPLAGFQRFVRRDPLGVVLTIAPWNYPYLTAVNSIVPAILAGNSVLLRHSAQTPLAAERFDEAFRQAGLPTGVFQILHAQHADVERMIASPEVDFVAFTGSAGVGRSIQQAAAQRFIGVGLELGGKDPAYVRADSDLDPAAEGIVDGAFFNAGQSCCGIERVYVHREVWSGFVERVVEHVRAYRLGDPLDPAVTLGPLVRTSAAEHVRSQIAEARAAGARALIDPSSFERDAAGSPYLAPQILVDVDHGMRVMTEESFGPVVGLMRVRDDDEAVERMNQSEFGLTTSVWTRDVEAARALGDRVECGTFFMNRCDVLDPALAWTGVKNSGRGCTLSRIGFESLTRPKSFHLRLPA